MTVGVNINEGEKSEQKVSCLISTSNFDGSMLDVDNSLNGNELLLCFWDV